MLRCEACRLKDRLRGCSSPGMGFPAAFWGAVAGQQRDPCPTHSHQRALCTLGLLGPLPERAGGREAVRPWDALQSVGTGCVYGRWTSVRNTLSKCWRSCVDS